jgi:hypothetical protein
MSDPSVWYTPPRFWAIIMAGPPVVSVKVPTMTLISLETTHWKVVSPGFKSIPDRDMLYGMPSRAGKGVPFRTIPVM